MINTINYLNYKPLTIRRYFNFNLQIWRFKQKVASIQIFLLLYKTISYRSVKVKSKNFTVDGPLVITLGWLLAPYLSLPTASPEQLQEPPDFPLPPSNSSREHIKGRIFLLPWRLPTTSNPLFPWLPLPFHPKPTIPHSSLALLLQQFTATESSRRHWHSEVALLLTRKSSAREDSSFLRFPASGMPWLVGATIPVKPLRRFDAGWCFLGR